MISHRGRSRSLGLATLALVCAGALWLGAPVRAQDPQTQAQPDAPPAMPAPDPANKSGFIDAVGRWFEEGRAKLDSQLKDANEKMLEFRNRAQDGAKDAASAIVRWPNTRLTSGRERCEPAPNGAPDCRVAASALCRGKGFHDGQPFDTQSEDVCPSRNVLSGRAPSPGDCRTETFVIRAVCQ
jgi:hypothetical protein